MRVMNYIMDDKERISCVNLVSTFDNNDRQLELDEEVEQLVITEDKEDVEHNMETFILIKK